MTLRNVLFLEGKQVEFRKVTEEAVDSVCYVLVFGGCCYK